MLSTRSLAPFLHWSGYILNRPTLVQSCNHGMQKKMSASSLSYSVTLLMVSRADRVWYVDEWEDRWLLITSFLGLSGTLLGRSALVNFLGFGGLGLRGSLLLGSGLLLRSSLLGGRGLRSGNLLGGDLLGSSLFGSSLLRGSLLRGSLGLGLRGRALGLSYEIVTADRASRLAIE